MNLHNIIVYDWESDSPNPNTCNPTELGALVINPRTLSVIEGSEFNSMIRPSDIDDEDYFFNHKDTIEFHAKHQRKTVEEIIEGWRNAPLQQNVWAKFVDYTNRFHITQSKKSVFTAPIQAGYNILGFDSIIIDRLSKKYGNVDKQGRTTLFYSRDKIDVMLYSFMWFEDIQDLTSYSLDNLRDYLGMSSANCHTSLQDCYDTANILIKFMKLTRSVANKVKFKDSFKEVKVNE